MEAKISQLKREIHEKTVQLRRLEMQMVRRRTDCRDDLKRSRQCLCRNNGTQQRANQTKGQLCRGEATKEFVSPFCGESGRSNADAGIKGSDVNKCKAACNMVELPPLPPLKPGQPLNYCPIEMDKIPKSFWQYTPLCCRGRSFYTPKNRRFSSGPCDPNCNRKSSDIKFQTKRCNSLCKSESKFQQKLGNPKCYESYCKLCDPHNDLRPPNFSNAIYKFPLTPTEEELNEICQSVLGNSQTDIRRFED